MRARSFHPGCAARRIKIARYTREDNAFATGRRSHRRTRGTPRDGGSTARRVAAVRGALRGSSKWGARLGVLLVLSNVQVLHRVGRAVPHIRSRI